MRSKPVSPLSPLSFGEWVAGAELVGAMGAGGYQLRRLARGSRYELIVCGLTLPRLALWCGARGGEGAGYVPGAGFVGALVRDALGVGAREATEVALAGEAPQLAHAEGRLSGCGRPDALCRLDRRQVGVARVDRLQLEVVLEPGEVVVVLLVEVGDEAVGAVPVAVEVGGCRCGHRHGCVGYPPCAS